MTEPTEQPLTAASEALIESDRIQRVHDDGHDRNRMGDYDYYCVAPHGSDYSPKYLDGELCHDGMGEGWCHPECRQCPQDCPVTPCPWDDDIEEDA